MDRDKTNSAKFKIEEMFSRRCVAELCVSFGAWLEGPKASACMLDQKRCLDQQEFLNDVNLMKEDKVTN